MTIHSHVNANRDTGQSCSHPSPRNATPSSTPIPRGSRKERQFLAELRGPHSRKPAEIRKRIERMFPTQSRIELFARGIPSGWDAYGAEAVPTTSPWETDDE